MVFMDYKDYTNQKVRRLEAEYPTFLYAMPMTKTRVFFEVLSLVSSLLVLLIVITKKAHVKIRYTGNQNLKTYEEDVARVSRINVNGRRFNLVLFAFYMFIIAPNNLRKGNISHLVSDPTGATITKTYLRV
ncbi:hypothetical protein DY000_02001217 [Brassica cretica]|uniref:Uncharacterized protein n=1 Tax=Brassica cretica TaxID=69181 RepID=A0ABQ7C118_BRACR|nr:hypothetical protein DY000_02001217 [Brassica cretica]